MRTELAVVVGLLVAGVAALAVTPLAISVAQRTEFLDRPREYRKHARATPLLGGAAVMLAFLVAALAVGSLMRFWVLVACATVMWAIGTADDRFAVPPKWRLLAEGIAAVALFSQGLGWHVTGHPLLDVALTVLWCVCLVNAFNLMDNLDGACGSVGCVSALGIAGLAFLRGDAALAGMACGLAAACAGFLRYNLAGPSRIFLGDGGSMPIGFLIAGLGMAVSHSLHIGVGALFAVAMTAGVVILDTTLVSVSRTRRGVSLMTGGRDHLSHRLLRRLASARAVAGALALTQALLCSLAIAAAQLGTIATLTVAVLAAVAGVAAIAVLDTVSWRGTDLAVTDAAAGGAVQQIGRELSLTPAE